MSKFIKHSVLAIFFIMVAVLVAGCSSGSVSQKEEAPPPSAPTSGLVQSNTAGSVTIDVEWVKREGNFLIFDVSMNTHSVNLNQYDLKELAVLRDDEDQEYSPISWDSPPGDEHHRRDTLTFPLLGSVSQGKARYIEIVIRDVDGTKERVLKWEL